MTLFNKVFVVIAIFFAIVGLGLSYVAYTNHQASLLIIVGMWLLGVCYYGAFYALAMLFESVGSMIESQGRMITAREQRQKNLAQEFELKYWSRRKKP